MTRPTKGQVDAAIEHYYEEAQCAIERNCAEILADEVVALRQELAAAHSANKTLGHNLDLFREASEAAELRLVDMRQELERASIDIEDALVARDKWQQLALEQKAAVERVEAYADKHDGQYYGMTVAGFRKALRGEP